MDTPTSTRGPLGTVLRMDQIPVSLWRQYSRTAVLFYQLIKSINQVVSIHFLCSFSAEKGWVDFGGGVIQSDGFYMG